MNAVDLMAILGELRVRYRESDIEPAIAYFTAMLKDSRVIIIRKDYKLYAVLTFSVTNDHEKFLKKGVWEYLPHDPKGSCIYVEKLISTGWDKELRTDFESTVTFLYPQIEYGLWHRWARWGDRQVIAKVKRRVQNVRN